MRAGESNHMASVEQHVEQEILQVSNGAARPGEEAPVETRPTGEIPVENPATGETIRTVADLDADAIAEMASRARLAQPEWDAYGFDGRARVLSRAQKWLMDNAQRGIETNVSGTGENPRG